MKEPASAYFKAWAMWMRGLSDLKKGHNPSAAKGRLRKGNLSNQRLMALTVQAWIDGRASPVPATAKERKSLGAFYVKGRGNRKLVEKIVQRFAEDMKESGIYYDGA